jgi:UDP-N-acetylmuramoyl-L-alanyl-D-glutamate--2,6-diaminopimelate ligase
MKLRELLAESKIAYSSEHPNLELEVTGLKTNSHTCTAGDLFIGLPGTRVDGGEFWQGAIAAGAVVVSFLQQRRRYIRHQLMTLSLRLLI